MRTINQDTKLKTAAIRKHSIIVTGQIMRDAKKYKREKGKR
jgi:hypothetical protein